MKALLQRVTSASVDVDGERIAAIGRGLLVFVAAERSDTPAQAERLLDRVVGYRIFADASDRMNLSLQDIQGELLVVPQFTLVADTRTGRRPSFSNAGEPAQSQSLFEAFLAVARQQLGPDRLKSGCFGADMQVALVNDGPVTFWLEVPVAVDTVV